MADTPARLLRLLSLLQTPREWPGPELARRLEVSERTVRNDVERLRRLGYPVRATRGSVGGYRLAAGQAMPPLLLDDDEAVAVAVSLATNASSGVRDVDETALRALTKLRQVLPQRLASRVDALQATMLRPRGTRRTPDVEGGVLAFIAAAAHDREVLRFAYSDHSGAATERRAEPYRLVSWGGRWFLVAFDVERDDWRIFRVDRLREARSVGHRFRARALPAEDVAAWVAARTRQVQRHATGTVLVHASAEHVSGAWGVWAEGAIEPLGPDRCRISVGGRTPDEIAFWLGALRADFEVDPGSPDLAAAVRGLAARYTRATPSAASDPAAPLVNEDHSR